MRNTLLVAVLFYISCTLAVLVRPVDGVNDSKNITHSAEDNGALTKKNLLTRSHTVMIHNCLNKNKPIMMREMLQQYIERSLPRINYLDVVALKDDEQRDANEKELWLKILNGSLYSPYRRIRKSNGENSSSGGFSRVIYAERIAPNGKRDKVAVKHVMLGTTGWKRTPMFMVIREIRMLKYLKNRVPMISQMYGAYWDDSSVFIVMRLEEGSDFITTINSLFKQSTYFSHNAIVKISAQLALIFWLLNDAKVLYADLKLDNIIYTENNGITLVDFGLARMVRNNSHCYRAGGTSTTIAPEMVYGKHAPDTRADVWSLGIVYYMIFAGVNSPFQHNCNQFNCQNEHTVNELNAIEFYNVIKQKDYIDASFFETEPQLLHLIRQMLVREPSKRITIDEVLRHQFFLENNVDFMKLLTDSGFKNAELIEKFRNFLIEEDVEMPFRDAVEVSSTRRNSIDDKRLLQ